MKFPGALLLSLLPALLAAGAAAPPPPPASAPAPATHLAPASDYTTRAMDPPLQPEFDASQLPPPPMAEPSAPGDDGTRKCVGPDGVPIFTDRRCGDFGATPRLVLPPLGAGGAVAPGAPLRVRTCARNQSMLLDGVRAALESHDANRLADYYHWTGMSSTQGYKLMERLDAFSARPVVDVRLVREARPEEEELDLYSDRFDPLLPPPGLDDDDPQAEPALPDGEAAPPPPPPRRRPLASMLRVDQMSSSTDVAATVTYFHLLTNAGCWWVRF